MWTVVDGSSDLHLANFSAFAVDGELHNVRYSFVAGYNFARESRMGRNDDFRFD